MFLQLTTHPPAEALQAGLHLVTLEEEATVDTKNHNNNCFTIKDCWTCGVQTVHHSRDCNCKVKGRKDNATVDNCQGGSNRGISRYQQGRVNDNINSNNNGIVNNMYPVYTNYYESLSVIDTCIPDTGCTHHTGNLNMLEHNHQEIKNNPR
eukprot:12768986-Ditylum_brightwellii.AAC.1